MGAGILLYRGVGVPVFLYGTGKAVFTGNATPVLACGCGDPDISFGALLQQAVCLHRIVGDVGKDTAEIQVLKGDFRGEDCGRLKGNPVFLAERLSMDQDSLDQRVIGELLLCAGQAAQRSINLPEKT